MEHPQFEHSLTVAHKCGSKYQLNTVEWPAKLVVCPTCHDLLSLERYDDVNGNVIYQSLGDYRTYKESKRETGKMIESVFDYLEADNSERLKASRTSMRVANKRVKDQYGEFLSAAENFEDHKARLDLVSDNIKETIHEVVSEYGGDPASIEASILRNLSGVEKLAPGDQHLPASPKRNRQYEHIKEQLIEAGKSEDEAKEEAARTVNKQRAEKGETKDSSVHESRRPKLCPYHSEVVDISLASGDPRAGFDSMAQHAWGPNHCQGEGYEGRCNFKRDMVTQSYWDEKTQQAQERREQRELERERLLEQVPQAPEGEIGDAPEPDLVDEPMDIDAELADAPSAIGEPAQEQLEPAMASTHVADADRDGGGAVKTVELDEDREGPVPEMDKTRWTTENVTPIDTEMDGSPHPTKEKDILEPIKPETSDSFLDETDSVTEQQELPSANDDGYSTDKNTETIHTDTWGGNNGASPVTRETQSKVAVDPGLAQGPDVPPNSPDEAFAEQGQPEQAQQLEPGSTVIVTPQLGPGEGYMRDTEAGAQPWEAHFVGYSADGQAVVDTGPGEYGGIRKMDPAMLKPKQVFNDHAQEPQDPAPGAPPDSFPDATRGASIDPDKNPIQQILEDDFVPQLQADEAISRYEE